MANDKSPNELRELWLNQQLEPFQISPDELRLKMEQLNKERRKIDFISYVIGVGSVIWFIFWIFVLHVLLLKIGMLLIILGMGYLLSQGTLDRHNRTASLARAIASGETDSLEFYRTELERQRDFHRGVQLWSRLVAVFPGIFVIAIWPIVAFPFPIAVFGYAMLATTLILFALAVWGNRRKSADLSASDRRTRRTTQASRKW